MPACRRRPLRTPRSWRWPSDSSSRSFSSRASRPGRQASEDLELVEQVDDALERLAVVLDLLTGLALRRGRDRGDLLTGARPADRTRVEPEVARGDGVDGLVLRRHDPLERRVARLDDPGGHAHDRGQRRLDDVVTVLGLALDGDLAVGDLDVLRERERRPAEQLGDLTRDRARVTVGRLRRGDEELDAARAL